MSRRRRRLDTLSVQPPVPVKSSWKSRFFSFIEQPLFLAVASILGGIVGVIFYTPILLVCGGCILLALHRSKAVHGLSQFHQWLAYIVIGTIATVSLFSIRISIRNQARAYVYQI